MTNNPLSESETKNLENLLEKGEDTDLIISKIKDLINKKVEDTTLKTQKKYQHLFKHTPLTIVVFNSDGILLDINEAANKLMSMHTVEDLIGKHYRDFWNFNEQNKKLIPIYDNFFERLLNRGEPSDIEFPIHQSKGEVVWVHAYTSIFEVNNQIYVQFLLEDITERKESKEKLKESQEIFKTIANQSFIGIVILQDDLFKYFNDEFLKVTGYSRKEVEDWNPGEYIKIIHPDYRDYVKKQANLKQYGKENYVENYEFRGLRKNGEPYWSEIFSKTVYYNGTPADLIMTLDITERKRREQKLKESEEKFRTIAEQTSIGIAIFQNKTIEYVNYAYTNIMGYPYEKVKNWSYEDVGEVIYSEDLVKVRNSVKKFQRNHKNEKPTTYITRIETKKKKIKWLETTLKSIKYQDEDAVLVTVIDITDKKKAERELKKLNKLKSEWLRRTSHELKTPLVSIKGFSNLLTELYSQKLDEEMKAILDEIKKGSDRLENLIKNILEASKLQSEKIEIHKTYGNLAEIIDEILNELDGLIKRRKHSIDLNLDNNLKTRFEPKRIKEVIENLLVNAIKYTPPEGKITINSERKEEDIRISFKDNGIGLTEEEQEILFREFGKIERYGKGYDVETEGTGLGLYICKQIIELHGGTIGVKSKGKNKGTTFYFTLPIVK